MVHLTRIYTRSGDKGSTSLSTGKRVPKYNLRVQTYGTVDETNTVIGLARLYTSSQNLAYVDTILLRVQNELFDLGADLCTPVNPNASALRVVESQVKRLEQEIDTFNAYLSPLTSFVLPGGVAAAGYLHHARTVCRRAERLLTELVASESQEVNLVTLQYINRLSDHLFVLARYLNNYGQADVLWIPGISQTN